MKNSEIIKKYGRENCLLAYAVHLDGEGADEIGRQFQEKLKIEGSERARTTGNRMIDAGREIAFSEKLHVLPQSRYKIKNP